MDSIDQLFKFVVFVLIASFATGLIMGGPEKGKQILLFELDMLIKAGRWLLGHALQLLSEACAKLAQIVRR